MLRLLGLIVICIFIFPPLNVGGVPLRVEDFIFVCLIVFNYKNLSIILVDKEVQLFLLLLFLFFTTNVISFIFSVSEGYKPVLGDLNHVMSHLRNIFVFCAGLIIGKRIGGDLNQVFFYLFFGLFLMSIVSVVQFYNLFGIGQQVYLMYGLEERLQYGITRAIGTVRNPNYASFFHLVALILLLVIRVRKYNWLMLLYFLCLFIVLLSIVLTYSRTGLVAAFVVFCIYLYKINNIKIVLISAVVGMMSMAYFLPDLNNSRLAVLLSDNEKFDYTFNSRLDAIWLQRVDRFLNNPFFGIGSQKASDSGTGFSTTTFDNVFLNILVINGVVGFIIYFVFLLTIIIFFKRFRDSDVRSVYLFILLFFSLIFLYFFTTDLNNNIYFTTFFYLITGSLIMYVKTSQKKKCLIL